MKGIVSRLMLTLLLMCILAFAFNIQLIEVESKLIFSDFYQGMKKSLEKDPLNRTISIIDAGSGLNSIMLGSPAEPMPSEGYSFAVNVTLDGETDYLHSFQVAVAFNKAKVKCDAALIPKYDLNFVFYGQSPLIGFVGVYNDLGLVVLGSSLSEDYVIPDHRLPRHVNVTGWKLLCQINFTAIDTGVSFLEIVKKDEYEDPLNTILMDVNNNPIDFTSKSFSLTVIARELPSLIAHVCIKPHTLNLRSRGKWIICFIELPEGYSVNDINVSSIMLNDTIPAKVKHKVVGDYDCGDVPYVMVKFNRAEVISYVIANINKRELHRKRVMTVTLTMTGYLNDGTPFQGSDTIRIILPIPRCERFIQSYLPTILNPFLFPTHQNIFQSP